MEGAGGWSVGSRRVGMEEQEGGVEGAGGWEWRSRRVEWREQEGGVEGAEGLSGGAGGCKVALLLLVL